MDRYAYTWLTYPHVFYHHHAWGSDFETVTELDFIIQPFSWSYLFKKRTLLFKSTSNRDFAPPSVPEMLQFVTGQLIISLDGSQTRNR